MTNDLEIEKLKEKRDELRTKLSDPEILLDSQKIRALSIEFGKIEKEIREKTRKITNAGSNQKIIMEIRAGAGGGEAALFAAELFQMYSAFAKRMNWDFIILDSSRTALSGLKEIIFEVGGPDVFAKLKNESGVHRVQRIPATEKSGRIHTSTASVAVLPEAEEKDIEIRPQDTKIEFFRSSGPGGQNVNKVETGVRLIHLPTGVIVSSQESRSQQQNREHAIILLRTKLLETKRLAEEEKLAHERRQQIGTADRSEKIRTYNFPQDRVTDHRIKENFHNINDILNGNLEPIIEKFQEKAKG